MACSITKTKEDQLKYAVDLYDQMLIVAMRTFSKLRTVRIALLSLAGRYQDIYG